MTNRDMKYGYNFGWRPKIVSRLGLYASPGVGAPSGAGPAAPPAASPSAPAAPAAPAPAAAPSSGAPPASPTGSPTGTSPAALPANEPNIAVLRAAHDAITKLGGIDRVASVQQAATVLNNLHTEGLDLATKLGFTPESFEKGFAQDPADVVAFLRSEAAKANNIDSNAPPDINKILDQRLGPVEQQLRLRQVQEANATVDTELGRVFSDHAIFKGKSDIPAEVSGFIQDLTRENLKYDKDGLKKIMSGDLAPIKVSFDRAIDQFFKALNGYSQWQSKSGGNAPATPGAPAPAAPPAAKFNIQDIIDGKEDAFQGLSTTRR